ncbi:MAG: hypothetical protein D6766_03300 [Verrucomicrobia bacterium]|nr:MAG: hypothetical protein D6766_03300 [Verrucomicrobiota bacterium]
MRWKAIGAALVLFLAGVLSGMMGQRLLSERSATPAAANPAERRPGPPPPWDRQRMSFIDRLTQELKLTPEQASRINALMKESQERMRQLWETIKPEADKEITRTREAMKEILTPEQQAKLEAMFKHGPRRGGGWRGGGFRPHEREGGKPGFGPAEPPPDQPPPSPRPPEPAEPTTNAPGPRP